MKFSPCGWFCFDEPEGWICEDTPTSILLRKQSARIEVTSARKAWNVSQEELAEAGEDLLLCDGLPRGHVSVYRLPQGPECLQMVTSDGNRVVCLAYAHWSRYCATLRMDVPTSEAEGAATGLRDLLGSLQPLTTD